VNGDGRKANMPAPVGPEMADKSLEIHAPISNPSLIAANEAPDIRATHTGELCLGQVVTNCAVLEDGERVLSMRGLASAFALESKKKGSDGAPHWPVSLTTKGLEPYLGPVLAAPPNRPRWVLTPQFINGKHIRDNRSLVVRAEVIVDIARAYVAAYLAGALRKDQEHIAKRCMDLLSALAGYAMRDLVDKATGYTPAPSRDTGLDLADPEVALMKLMEVNAKLGEVTALAIHELRGRKAAEARVAALEVKVVETQEIVETQTAIVKTQAKEITRLEQGIIAINQLFGNIDGRIDARLVGKKFYELGLKDSGPRKIFGQLIEHKWAMKRSSGYEPMQERVNRGHLFVKFQTRPDGDDPDKRKVADTSVTFSAKGAREFFKVLYLAKMPQLLLIEQDFTPSDFADRRIDAGRVQRALPPASKIGGAP
jgi:hypothetical protein